MLLARSIPLAPALLLSAAAWAQEATFDVAIDRQAAQRLGLDASAVEQQLSSTINGNLNIADQQAFLDAMANAATLATKGMGVDYASNPRRFVLGASLGSAVNSGGAHLTRGEDELPDYGFNLQLAGMAGINLGMGDKESPLSRFVIYANGLALGTTGDSFDTAQYNLGVHAQIKLVTPVKSGAMEWGGLDLTAGYERATYELVLRRELPVRAEEGGADINWAATGEYTVTANAGSVPLELSSNLRLLLLTLYGGGALDINTGDAASTVSLSGPITGEAGGEEASLGTALVSLADSGLADPLVPRVFVGAQVNLAFLKAYGHLNIGMNDSFGGHVGARIAL